LAAAAAILVAVHAHRAELEQTHLPRQLQHPHKGRAQQRPVLAPELRDGVVVGMMVGAEVTHRHAVVTGPLHRPRAERARGITVNEQRQHQSGRILRIAGATHIDPRLPQVGRLHRLQDKERQFVSRHPLPHIRR